MADEPNGLTETDAKVAAAIAQLDQEQADWTTDAAKLGTFWTVIKSFGISDDLAAGLTLNAQINYYGGIGVTIEKDDDD